MQRNIFPTIAIVLMLFLGACSSVIPGAGDVPRMTKEQLKPLLGDADVVVLDLRSGRDWNASEFKIKGAIREIPEQVDSWAAKYPTDKTLVLYCA